MEFTTENSDLFSVVVIGGGLAGLTAALHLADRGLSPLVIEADHKWAGGRLCGGDPDVFEHQGRTWQFPSEHGAHALWGGYHNMRAMLKRFLHVKLLESSGEEWINRWGNEVRAIEAGNAIRSRWIPAPFHYLQLLFRPRFWGTITPLDFLSLPGFVLSLLWTLGFDPLKEKIDLPGLMLKEYFRGWTPNLKATFTGLGNSLLAANKEAIHLTAFIAAIRFYTMLRRDDWKLEYLSGNADDALIRPMLNGIEERGGGIQFGWRAGKIEKSERGWKLRVEDTRRGITRTIEAATVILAVPPLAGQKLLTESPSLGEETLKMRFPRGVENAAVRLWFDASPRKGSPGGMFTGDFKVDNFFWLHRLHEEFAAWHTEVGGSAIEVHIYGREEMLKLPDRMIVIQATHEVQLAFPELRNHFVYGAVRHNGNTHTEFIVPTAKSLHVKTPWEGIYACGDWIGYETPALWMERCTVTGIAAANHVLERFGLTAYEILPPSKPELLPRLLGGLIKILRRLFAPLFVRAARLFIRKKSRESLLR